MIDIDFLDRKLSNAVKADVTVWKPVLLNLKKEGDLAHFLDILDTKKPVVTDEIVDQVKELIKCQYPRKRLSGAALLNATNDYFGSEPKEIYGVWVYYPWSNRLVHILDKKEFTQVRTNRNHYKISPREQEILATKKVGLVGLSVGQSVAVTMAMERGFGELRLADFDALELTNLNRIRTGVHNMGLSKVYAVAREILEIDPYLKLTCFTDGLTEENIDDFFTKGGNLDLFIDECDGLDIKVLSRYKAREMKIPVVMEASDRGMVDVERFDLEPNRPLLHGTIGDLNPEKLKTLKTNEDKIPYMLAIVGADTISTRAKASMLEIGETITTWPQLASAVTLGGGITADVVRRILLDQYHESGRYYVDVEALIGNKNKLKNERIESKKVDSGNIDFGSIPKAAVNELHLNQAAIENIAKAACHAPSGGNLQPWRWSYSDGIMQLKQDASLISSFLDHNFIASYIALGASLENAVLAGVKQGVEASVNNFPVSESKDIIAHLTFAEKADFNADDKKLSQHIFDRRTNRNIEPGEKISAEHIQYLKRIAEKNGSELLIIEDSETKEALSDVIAFAERFRIMHPTGHQNFIEEMRWSAQEAEETKDGIDINTVDLTVGELTGFKLARETNVIDKLVEWGGGTAFEKLSRKSTSAASVLGIITRHSHSPIDFIDAGRDMERVWIGANAEKIGFQPQSPISLILQRLSTKNDLSDKQAIELQIAANQLKRIISPLTTKEPVFIFRLFYAHKPVVKSYRRNINEHFQKR
ncbi:Rv1355c family protein [Cryomorpha ignava]|uniref:Rv1355c family protein n=1 Tax=Cryomorpha ignava TaxID=101383 RepID=A0A7K3WVX4_9FLAO|nr:Rv1355c family protein [Cryomorpha ignava]NEN25666.1 Rv1355c family protein [Cryomorpha ignava]